MSEKIKLKITDRQGQKHDVDVEIDNVCNDHSIKKAFSKLSDCINCSNYKKVSCPNPGHSAAGMLCFSWSTY